MNKRRGFKSDREGSVESQNGDYSSHGSEQKKSRLEDTMSMPSKVIHIRNLPLTVSEEELCQLAVPFGRITNMIYARRNNQALLEMEELSAASNMVAFYEVRPPSLQGRSCIVQFSRHATLDTRNENAAVVRAIEMANSMSRRDGVVRTNPPDLGRTNTRQGGHGGEFNAILHVVLENRTNEPINHLLLYKVFSQSGRVLKIVMFTKLKMEHALIEFDTPMSAMSAKVNLDSKALLGGRYPMRVEFSKMDHLDVRAENNKCRDFERSPLNEIEHSAIEALSLVSDLVVDNCMNPSPGMMMGAHTGMSNSMPGQHSGGMGHYGAGMPDAHGNRSMYYPGSNTGIPSMSADTNSDANSNALNNLAALLCLSRMGGGSSSNPLPESWMNAQSGLGNMFNPNYPMGNALGDMSQRYDRPMDAGGPRSVVNRDQSVLIVSNLNESKVEPDSLQTLFGVYGDVQRVKIMFNKKNTALIQFVDPQQASMAKDCLNNVMVWGQALKINISRHNSIQMPREDDNYGLTKDYTNSNLHRFKNKNYKNIFPPGPVLHFSNIPSQMSDSEISDLLQSRGFQIVNVRSLQKDTNSKKMALVQFLSTEESIMALINLHNYKVNPSTYLRVSFSSRSSNKNQ